MGQGWLERLHEPRLRRWWWLAPHSHHPGWWRRVGNANTDVQNLIAAGQVSATTAVHAVRQHGDAAGQVLSSELEKAQANGKKKVTAGTIKGPSIPKARLEAVHTASSNLLAELGQIDEQADTIPLSTDLVIKLRAALDGAQLR